MNLKLIKLDQDYAVCRIGGWGHSHGGASWWSKYYLYLCFIGTFVDGPYAGKNKISFPMRWRILQWMSTMRPCMEKQGPLTIAELVGVVCDLMVEVANARDKGRMWWSLWRNGSCFSHMQNWLSARHDSWIDWIRAHTCGMMILGWTSHSRDQEEVLVEPSVEEPWWERPMWR